MHERSKSPSKEALRRPRLTFGRYLLTAGWVLVVLFVVLNPSASNGLGMVQRLVFWTLHIWGPLLCLLLVQRLLDGRPFWRQRPWIAVAAAGVLGAWLFAPLAVGLESVLDLPVEPPDDVLDHFAARHGFLGTLLAEALALSLPVSLTWIALQLPWLLRLDFTEATAAPVALAAEPVDLPEPEITEGEPTDEASERPSAEASPAVVSEATETTDDPHSSSGSEFFDALPAALGRDVVALSAQLHYLDVHTTRGRSLVLYNLRDAVGVLDRTVEGLQIHRSHWVADRHVRRLVRQGKNWRCELSNGLELPVSRRRQGEAKRRWGSGRFVG